MTNSHQATALSAVFSTGSYLYFFVVLCGYFVFMLPREVLPSLLQSVDPYSIGSASTYSFWDAIWVDIFLMAAFCVPHSVLARPAVKHWMSLPHNWERPFYILQSAVLLHLQMHYWRNFEGPILYDVIEQTWIASATLALFGTGFLFLVTATFALDHFSLTGLTQGLGVDINRAIGLSAAKNEDGITVRWNYTLVSHPIMTGMLTGLWASPILTTPKLLLATFDTLYIVLAVRLLEEPDLENSIGPEYRQYLGTVPRFCPFAPPPRFGGAINKPMSKDISTSLENVSDKTKLMAPTRNSRELDVTKANGHRDALSTSPKTSKCPFH